MNFSAMGITFLIHADFQTKIAHLGKGAYQTRIVDTRIFPLGSNRFPVPCLKFDARSTKAETRIGITHWMFPEAETRICTDTRIFVGKQVHILLRPQSIYTCVTDARF